MTETSKARQPKIVEKDNGYFEVWELPDGSRVRVTTEFEQWARKHRKGERARLNKLNRERLAARFAKQQQEEVA